MGRIYVQVSVVPVQITWLTLECVYAGIAFTFLAAGKLTQQRGILSEAVEVHS